MRSKWAAAKYLATKDQAIIEEAYRGFAPLFPKIPYVTEKRSDRLYRSRTTPGRRRRIPKIFMTIDFFRSWRT